VKFALAFVLVASLFLNILLGFETMSRRQINGSSKNLSFFWNPKTQNITNGTLQMLVDLDWSGSNLSIVVEINDDDFSRSDYLGLVFDKNGNRDLYNDLTYYLNAEEREDWPTRMPLDPQKLEPWGGLSWSAAIGLRWSPYHRCSWNTETGYVFNVGIPKSELNFTQPMLMHLCFDDANLLYKLVDLGFHYPEYNKMVVVWVEFEV